jgi:hypothetical protein
MRFIIALFLVLVLPVLSFASMRDPSWKTMTTTEVYKAPFIAKEIPLIDLFKGKYNLSTEQAEKIVRSARAAGSTILMLAIMMEDFEFDGLLMEKTGKGFSSKHGMMHVSEEFLKKEPFKSRIKEEFGVTTVEQLAKAPMWANFCIAHTILVLLIKKHDGKIFPAVNEYGMGNPESGYADAVYEKVKLLNNLTGADKD